MRFDRFSQLLAHWAEAAPQAPALRCGGRSLSFAETWEAVRTRAEALRT